MDLVPNPHSGEQYVRAYELLKSCCIRDDYSIQTANDEAVRRRRYSREYLLRSRGNNYECVAPEMSASSERFDGVVESIVDRGAFESYIDYSIKFLNAQGQRSVEAVTGTVSPIYPFGVYIDRIPELGRSITLTNGPVALAGVQRDPSGAFVGYVNPPFSMASFRLATQPDGVQIELTDNANSIKYVVVVTWPITEGGSLQFTAAVANLSFDPITGSPTQPSQEPDFVPLPRNGLLLGAPAQHPIFVTRCGGKTTTLCSKHLGKRDTFIPTITVEAETAAQGQDFGSAFFTVLDNKKHSGTFNCKHRVVKVIIPGGVVKGIESQFSQFPQFNCIVKGKGCTLRQKFRSLIGCYGLETTLENFTAHMALYMYSKYILSRLLYGDFSVDYLSSCLDTKFLHHLEKSEYSDFSVIFTDREIGLIGFGRYFKCACGGKCER